MATAARISSNSPTDASMAASAAPAGRPAGSTASRRAVALAQRGHRAAAALARPATA